MNAPLLKHLIKHKIIHRFPVKGVARHHRECCFKVLSVSWSGVGCSYVTATQLPTSWEKVSLLAKHAQTALLLSLSIPPRSASPAIWKKYRRLLSSHPLLSLYISITSPFHLHHFRSHLHPWLLQPFSFYLTLYYYIFHSLLQPTVSFWFLFSKKTLIGRDHRMLQT